MMRSMVWGASWVCRVAKTRWPVSAAVRAVAMVSWSRISPTRMTSGSWRRARLQRGGEALGVGPDLALVDDRLLVPVDELDRVLDRHDVHGALWLISSIMAARVVDLPEPVGPVTSTSPRGLAVNSWSNSGSPSSSSLGISTGIRRNAAPRLLRW